MQRICCSFIGRCRKSKAPQWEQFASLSRHRFPARNWIMLPAALSTRWETITPMLLLATIVSADNRAPLVHQHDGAVVGTILTVFRVRA